MKFAITNGDTYIMRSHGNALIATKCIDDILIFDSKETATRTIIALPKRLQHQGYVVRRIVDIQLEESDDYIVDSSGTATIEEYKREITKKTGQGISFKVDDPDWLVSLKNDLLKVDEVLGKVSTMDYQLSKDLSNTNKELLDLEHAIEFLRPNAVQKCYLESELKKVRQKRRSLKDAKFLLEVILSFKWSDWGSGEIERIIKNMKEREYTPRIRKDLFE